VLPKDIFAALAQCPAFVTVFSRDGKMLWLSHSGYGYRSEDFIDGPADAAIVEEDRPLWWDAFRRARDDRELVRYRVRVGTPEPPHTAVLEGRIAPVVQRGRVTHVICAAWDVTRGFTDRSPIPAGLPAGSRWLSSVGERVVSYLDRNRDRWVRSEEIADRVGESSGHRFRAQLTALVERRILEARAGAGYRLARGT
jgi:hypothetical protein